MAASHPHCRASGSRTAPDGRPVRLEQADASLIDSAFVALGLREGTDGRMLVLLFTDGMDTASWLDPLSVLDQARRSDLVVDAVRLDSPANRHTSTRHPFAPSPTAAERVRRWFLEEPQLLRLEFLPTLADETGGELIVASQSGDLRAAFVKIVWAFKTRYVLTYSPKDVAPAGWHPIDVRLKDRKGDVRARRGYTR